MHLRSTSKKVLTYNILETNLHLTFLPQIAGNALMLKHQVFSTHIADQISIASCYTAITEYILVYNALLSNKMSLSTYHLAILPKNIKKETQKVKAPI